MATPCKVVLIAGAFMWLSGCAVGPDYLMPVEPVPKLFGSASLTPAAPAASAPDSVHSAPLVRWWQTLHDRHLDALIERAVVGNPDIEIALARVQQAREQEIVVLGAMLPTVGGSAAVATGSGTDLTKGREAQSIRAGDSTSGLQQINRIAGFDAGWELDLFGKYQRALEAARDDAEAQAELRNMVLITVIGDVAHYYLDIRALQMQLEIAKSDVVTAQKTVDLLTTRFDRGLSNELDLTLAKRQLATQQAMLPQILAQIAAAQSRLALLLGTYSAAIDPEVRAPGKLPALPHRVRPGVPPDLLRRRPDVRQTERELAAQNARIGVATADLFPSVALTAGFGAQGGITSGGTTTATPIHGPIWSFGPGAYWPLLDFGRLDALVNIEEYKAHEALANYKKTIISAVEEVDLAIKQYQLDLQHQRDLIVALDASHRAVDLATERYERGVTDFLYVLDAQREDYAIAEQTAVAAESVVLDYVAFYKALGGGWELYADLPPIKPAQPAVMATVRRVSDGFRQ
ncbi:MAG: efflux transporter outer membrane subunit [Alphaproteobacteria bacterium]|nr:efflux transporter outer membrane subunit [Alphaproteobacteria bacterium]